MIDERLTSENLINHTAARLRVFRGVYAGFDAVISKWKRLLEKSAIDTDYFDKCPVCGKEFESNELPYFGIFEIEKKRFTKILCKDCAYRIARSVIENDGSLHSGQYRHERRIKQNGKQDN